MKRSWLADVKEAGDFGLFAHEIGLPDELDSAAEARMMASHRKAQSEPPPLRPTEAALFQRFMHDSRVVDCPRNGTELVLTLRCVWADDFLCALGESFDVQKIEGDCRFLLKFSGVSYARWAASDRDNRLKFFRPPFNADADHVIAKYGYFFYEDQRLQWVCHCWCWVNPGPSDCYLMVDFLEARAVDLRETGIRKALGPAGVDLWREVLARDPFGPGYDAILNCVQQCLADLGLSKSDFQLSAESST